MKLKFDKQFFTAILSGRKKQTVRKADVEIKAGDDTDFCLVEEGKRDLEFGKGRCKQVFEIKIEEDLYIINDGKGETFFTDDQRKLTFAKAEGFSDWLSFTLYIKGKYGLPFRGKVITW